MIAFSSLMVLQFLFTYSRTMGTRHVAKDNVMHTVIWGLIIQVLWLSTTVWSVKAVLDGDYIMVVAYLLGGVVGNYLAMVKKI